MTQDQSNVHAFDFFELLDPHFSKFTPFYSEESFQNPSNLQQEAQFVKQRELKTSLEKTGFGLIRDSSQPYWRDQKMNNIDFDWELKIKIDQVRQGNKDDTVDVNINFKTIICNFFKELILSNELSRYQQTLVHQFANRSPSFKSLTRFAALSNTTVINQLCLRLVESSDIIKRVMKSRCKISNKIQMIKFIEILRKNIMGKGKIIPWKLNRKK